jgi:hypothetical protein
MDFKNKYLKYKKKYLELKKQLGGVANVTAPNKIDDIYIQLWNNKDKEAFDNIVVDGKVDKKEYDENISKYFNLEVINFKNLNDDVYKSKIDSIFEFSDLNNDNRLTDNEVFSLSKRIRDKERLRIQSKDELKLEYKALNKIMGMEHIIPKGGTDREFKGIPGPDEDFSKKDTEKILKMFIRMRYLVEVKGKLEYITLDKRTKYEEEIFNLVCKNKQKCKFHNLPIEDFESSTIKEYVRILEIIKKYEDPNIDGSLVVHCGAGFGRTGTVFMIYIWFTDYTNDTDNCKEQTNKILETLNKLNKVLKDSKNKLEDSKNELEKKYYKKIDDLSKISAKDLGVLLKKRGRFLVGFNQELIDNLEDLFNNNYLKELKRKIIKNYTKGATNEIFDFDRDDLSEKALFYIRLYRMIKAIKIFEEKIKSNI